MKNNQNVRTKNVFTPWLYEKEHCTILYIIYKIITNNKDGMFGLGLVGIDLVKHEVENRGWRMEGALTLFENSTMTFCLKSLNQKGS